jgi:hypothetical protein
MKKIFFFCLLPAFLSAQPSLGPHIGLNALPSASDPICTIPVYTGDMDTSGFMQGDTVPDFTLYKTNGDSVRLRDALMNGKPVLLVAGNYTCPKFREKITDLNDIATYYAGQLQVYVVYGVEAHPVTDPSPYSGVVWTTAENYAENVLYRQPTTYGERLEMIDSLLAHYTVVPEILVDGPCNNWWASYGPAPNNAYLIDTSGVVVAKQGWFNRAPDNMWCEIDSLLGTNSGNCLIVGNNGIFDFTLLNDSVQYGLPGDVLSSFGMIHNLSSTDNVEVGISKQFIGIPGDWSTALCADICYSPATTSTTVTIPPDDSLEFIFYFYTGATADSGSVKVRLKNMNITSNVIFQRYTGITGLGAGMTELNAGEITLYPNPSMGAIRVNGVRESDRIELSDPSGRVVYISGNNIAEIDISELRSGLYLYRIIRNKSVIKQGKLIKY